jgi:hypothetical protein
MPVAGRASGVMIVLALGVQAAQEELRQKTARHLHEKQDLQVGRPRCLVPMTEERSMDESWGVPGRGAIALAAVDRVGRAAGPGAEGHAGCLPAPGADIEPAQHAGERAGPARGR